MTRHHPIAAGPRGSPRFPPNTARRPRQQRRGREGEQQRPPERSPLLRLRGTRDVASAMLEEPEAGAPGARGEAAGRFQPALRERGSRRAACGPKRRLGRTGLLAWAHGSASMFVRGTITGPLERGLATRKAPLDVIVAATIFSALLRQFVLPERLR